MKKVNIDNIKVSSKLDDVIKNAVDEGYKSTARKKNKKFRKGAVAAVVAATIGVTLFGTSFGSEVIATMRLAIFDMGDYLGVNKDLEDYTTVVNSSVSKGGITVQLNEVIVDKDEVIVSTTTRSDGGLGESGNLLLFGDIYINGRRISSGSSGGSKQIDEYTMESVLGYQLEKALPEGDLNIEIRYNDALIPNVKESKGPWKFEFKANGNALAQNTNSVELNNSFTLENGQKVTLDEYRTNDIGQKIYYSVENKDKPYAIELRGYDDLGNEVRFYSSSESKVDGTIKNETTISEEAKILTLTPYAVAYPEESGEMSNDYKKVGEEFTIEIK